MPAEAQNIRGTMPPALLGAVFGLANVGMVFGKTRVLAGLNLEVAKGERIALIGPSGAGKTTLLRLLSGVLQPSEGRVWGLGLDLSQLRVAQLRSYRRRVGVLYQKDNLVPNLRVVHNVLMGRLPHWSLPRALLSLLVPQQRERAETALRRVELGERLWARPDELSGGQQQRVAIARLMVQEPEVVLADEPVSSLDVRLGREVVNLLTNEVCGDGQTLVVSLHSLELLRMAFTRVLALREGRVFFDGPVEDVTPEMLRELYGAEASTIHLDELVSEGAFS